MTFPIETYSYQYSYFMNESQLTSHEMVIYT